MALYLPLIFVFGLIVGSFLGAFTYRVPRVINFVHGRSFCPKCKGKIAWYDNIPLLSFIALRGKCRFCGRKISIRYPLIELSTAVVFTLVAFSLNNCATTFQGVSFKGEALCIWRGYLGHWALPYFLFTASTLIAIFVIDLENQLIPDNLVYVLFSTTVILLIMASPNELFGKLLSSFGASIFLLLTHLITRGRGMGLGDVKFALFGGLIFGWPQVALWLFLSFLIGAVVGVVLVVFGKASFGKHIPFGPFLVVSLFISLIWANTLTALLIP